MDPHTDPAILQGIEGALAGVPAVVLIISPVLENSHFFRLGNFAGSDGEAFSFISLKDFGASNAQRPRRGAGGKWTNDLASARLLGIAKYYGNSEK
ncbi:hypothetical protein HFN65_31965 [Rhizobium laguerreae]|uniref:hypothetical protein n=1 Tax=Rhizobium laguerreae TaxID=1076926 RepID=UPI001C902449|nr:hypothetical protein [Rhizobium laguerreae]MBY3503010.1 hypothetical protein [Rhizobium laguerreae]MBY3575553.1 hypothetical protein [Rhizobium laguerreae]